MHIGQNWVECHTEKRRAQRLWTCNDWFYKHQLHSLVQDNMLGLWVEKKKTNEHAQMKGEVVQRIVEIHLIPSYFLSLTITLSMKSTQLFFFYAGKSCNVSFQKWPARIQVSDAVLYILLNVTVGISSCNHTWWMCAVWCHSPQPVPIVEVFIYPWSSILWPPIKYQVPLIIRSTGQCFMVRGLGTLLVIIEGTRGSVDKEIITCKGNNPNHHNISTMLSG